MYSKKFVRVKKIEWRFELKIAIAYFTGLILTTLSGYIMQYMGRVNANIPIIIAYIIAYLIIKYIFYKRTKKIKNKIIDHGLRNKFVPNFYNYPCAMLPVKEKE